MHRPCPPKSTAGQAEPFHEQNEAQELQTAHQKGLRQSMTQSSSVGTAQARTTTSSQGLFDVTYSWRELTAFVLKTSRQMWPWNIVVNGEGHLPVIALLFTITRCFPSVLPAKVFFLKCHTRFLVSLLLEGSSGTDSQESSATEISCLCKTEHPMTSDPWLGSFSSELIFTSALQFCSCGSTSCPHQAVPCVQ